METAGSGTLPRYVTRLRLPWLRDALCILISVVFLSAAIAKTQSFRELEATLAASKLVPNLIVTWAGVLLLVTEYLISVLLILPASRRPALYAATIALSGFAAYSTWRWKQGITVPCHCFGALFSIEPWLSLLINLFLLILVSICITANPLSRREIPKAIGENA